MSTRIVLIADGFLLCVHLISDDPRAIVPVWKRIVSRVITIAATKKCCWLASTSMTAIAAVAWDISPTYIWWVWSCLETTSAIIIAWMIILLKIWRFDNVLSEMGLRSLGWFLQVQFQLVIQWVNKHWCSDELESMWTVNVQKKLEGCAVKLNIHLGHKIRKRRKLTGGRYVSGGGQIWPFETFSSEIWSIFHISEHHF